MADSPIGDIPVLITGDYSGLNQAIQDAAQAAQQGAQQISAAFSNADSGQVDSLASAANDLAEAAGGAAPPLRDLGAAETETAGNGEVLDASLQGISREMVELGEALAITEALKEFGKEALSAFSATQSAEISLTALTGSAQTAEEMISSLKDMAAELPVPFNDLVSAAQKMTALGFSVDQVHDSLVGAADAAAATGNSFQMEADSMDRIALSGQASARFLATLGLSTTDLATAMGVAQPQVTAVFKALDQSDRLTLVTAAMQKFGDVSQAEAEGLAGQWQILENQWDLLMDSIGGALAPLAENLLKITTTDIVPFLQSLVDEFNDLSPTMQDMILAAGIAAASLAPLAAAVGALGLSVAAMSGGIEALGNVVAIFGAIGAAAPEVEATGTALAGTEEATAVLGTTFAEVATGLAGLAAGFELLKLDGIINQVELLGTNLADLYAHFQPVITAVEGVVAAVMDVLPHTTALSSAWQELKSEFSDMSIWGMIQTAIDGIVPGLGAMRTGMEYLNASLETINGKFPSFSAALQAIQQQEALSTTTSGQLADAMNNLPDIAKNSAAQIDAMRNPMQGSSQDAVALAQAHAQAAAALAGTAAITAALNQATTALAAGTSQHAADLKAVYIPTVTSVADAEKAVNDARAVAVSADQDVVTWEHALEDARDAKNPQAMKDAEDNLTIARGTAKQANDDLKQTETNLKLAKSDDQQITKDLQQAQAAAAAALRTDHIPAVQSLAQAEQAVTDARTAEGTAMNAEESARAALAAYQQSGIHDDQTEQQLKTDLKTAVDNLKTSRDNEKQAITDANAIKSAQNALDASHLQLTTTIDSFEKGNVLGTQSDMADALSNINDLRQKQIDASSDLQAALQAENDLTETGTTDTQAIKDALENAKQKMDEYKDSTNALNSEISNLSTNTGLTKDQITILSTQTLPDAGSAAGVLQASFHDLGIKSAADLTALQQAAQVAFTNIQNSGVAAPGQILQAHIAALSSIQKAYEDEGQTLPNDQAIMLASMKQQLSDWQKDTVDQWSNLFSDINKDVTQASQAMINTLITGKGSFGDEMIGMLQSIAGSVLQDLVKPFEDAAARLIAGAFAQILGASGLGGITSSLSSIGIHIGGLGMASGGEAPSGGSALNSSVFSPGDYGQETGATGGGVGAAASAAASSITGIVGAIGSVGSFITGVIGDFQNAHMEDIMKSVELNTRLTAMFIGGLSDGGVQTWTRMTQDNTFNLNAAFNSWFHDAFAALMDSVAQQSAHFDGWFHDALASLMSTVEDIDAQLQKGLNVTAQSAGQTQTTVDPGVQPAQTALSAANAALTQAQQKAVVDTMTQTFGPAAARALALAQQQYDAAKATLDALQAELGDHRSAAETAKLNTDIQSAQQKLAETTQALADAQAAYNKQLGDAQSNYSATVSQQQAAIDAAKQKVATDQALIQTTEAQLAAAQAAGDSAAKLAALHNELSIAQQGLVDDTTALDQVQKTYSGTVQDSLDITNAQNAVTQAQQALATAQEAAKPAADRIYDELVQTIEPLLTKIANGVGSITPVSATTTSASSSADATVAVLQGVLKEITGNVETLLGRIAAATESTGVSLATLANEPQAPISETVSNALLQLPNAQATVLGSIASAIGGIQETLAAQQSTSPAGSTSATAPAPAGNTDALLASIADYAQKASTWSTDTLLPLLKDVQQMADDIDAEIHGDVLTELRSINDSIQSTESTLGQVLAANMETANALAAFSAAAQASLTAIVSGVTLLGQEDAQTTAATVAMSVQLAAQGDVLGKIENGIGVLQQTMTVQTTAMIGLFNTLATIGGSTASPNPSVAHVTIGGPVFNGPVVGGQQGLQELADYVNNAMTDKLRQAGFPF